MNPAGDITQEDLKVFLEEADEQIQLLDEDIVALEGHADAPHLIQEIFRAAHTLKGSSAMLGYQPMSELAHAMESLLDSVRQGRLEAGSKVIDALLHSIDTLRLLKDALIEPPLEEIDVKPHIADLNAAGAGASTDSPDPADAHDAPLVLDKDQDGRVAEITGHGGRAFRVSARLEEGSNWGAVRWFQVLGELSQLGEVIVSRPSHLDIDNESVGTSFQAVAASDAELEAVRAAVAGVAEVEAVDVTAYVPEPRSDEFQGQQGGIAAGLRQDRGSQTIRIDVDRLDGLMNAIGELVIDRTRIQQISRRLRDIDFDDVLIDDLGTTSDHIVKVVDELQDRVMQIRMLPIGNVFSGLPRLVRDLAHALDKKVEFIVEGHDTEIDRTVIERVRDPIVHLLRNAVDHGLEQADERSMQGKPETGQLRLSAYHEEGHIVVAVADDGRGIDSDRLRESAVGKGLLSEEAAANLTEDQALDLIFMPGNSTAAETTDVSGRGVGMDIVKSNIEAINGFVNLDTETGAGSRITLRLPLTLATVHSLLVESAGAMFAIPLVYVLETRLVRGDETLKVNHRRVFRLREDVIPLVELREIAVSRTAAEEIDDENGSRFTVIVQTGETRVGITVDAVVEPQEIVVKSLGRYIGDVKGIAGASILGDGRVVLILDVPTLINGIKQRQRRVSRDEPAERAERVGPPTAEAGQPAGVAA